MNEKKLKAYWKSEEAKGFEGWDFSHLNGRMAEEPLPWDYKETVSKYMSEHTVMLDMGTGGGEFLLSLSSPSGRTYATEAYLPNYELCCAKLPSYGIEVRLVEDDADLPLESGMFDLVINRHEAFNVEEVYRILKPGGIFITQQVGGMNNRELSQLLLGGDVMITDAEFDLDHSVRELKQAGFTVLEQREAFPEVRFLDIGALVYFAKIIEWEFPGFSVDRCYGQLCKLQKSLNQNGYVASREHRFFILARK
ncbi:class I SAM-dependent methyltransferase [Paenibacillus sp. Marseille-P2973]|uniref:class I SAM-dependent methyltransferase n=1 Tax=Paenibacillus sp. Marseille-P2973 TaxID=1871032 RepID=UPI001B361D20|nr:class I SAM-dependent methyltransferase [Paenibacillus sp. Marseille-P2973]MBQ4899578.1 class I SAM-dependent methyltransferase [Paenibacillus sp. Marseille-P2973]